MEIIVFAKKFRNGNWEVRELAESGYKSDRDPEELMKELWYTLVFEAHFAGHPHAIIGVHLLRPPETQLLRNSLFCFLMLLLVPVTVCQRSDVELFTAGVLNPTYHIYLSGQPGLEIIGTDKSSLGAGAEYRRYWGQHNAIGLMYAQNPSEGRLWIPSQPGNVIRWPMEEWNLLAVGTQRVKAARFAPFVSEGAGVLMTYGATSVHLTDSGLSADFALGGRSGIDYHISHSLSVRIGAMFLATRQGCYGDPTCHADWGLVKVVQLGMVHRWGRGNN